MFLEVTLNLLKGFGVTAQLFVLTLVIALPLGLIISFGSMSKLKVIRFPVKTLIWIIRGTPLLLQIAVFVYLPGFAFGIRVADRFFICVLAFGFNYACYFAEIYRGGIESISIGQHEAGRVLGLTNAQIFTRITLPQVIKRIVPPMGNEFITLVKDTALANMFQVFEIMYMARNYEAYAIIWPFFYAGVFYLLFNGIITLAFSYGEKKLNYYR